MGAPNGLHWLRRMAAASMMLVGGTGTAAAVSPQVLDDLLEEAERVGQDEAERVRLLRALANDPRPAVRALVAEAVAVLSPDAAPRAIELLRELSRDPSTHVRTAVGLGLAGRLERSSPAERIELVCEWALSRQTSERAAIARALAWRTPVLVTDLVLQQLAGDENAEVRALALRAAAAHLPEDPAAYRRVALDRLGDPDLDVRLAAETLLEREI